MAVFVTMDMEMLYMLAFVRKQTSYGLAIYKLDQTLFSHPTGNARLCKDIVTRYAPALVGYKLQVKVLRFLYSKCIILAGKIFTMHVA